MKKRMYFLKTKYQRTLAGQSEIATCQLNRPAGQSEIATGQSKRTAGQSVDNNYVPVFMRTLSESLKPAFSPIRIDFDDELVDEAEEPTRVDIDESGNEISSKGTRPAWSEPKGEFSSEAFSACHIKYWGAKQQRIRWNKIMSELFSVYGQEIKIRRAWISGRIDWAREKNLGRFAVAISIDNLMTAIDNNTLYEGFKIKYFKKGTAI